AAEPALSRAARDAPATAMAHARVVGLEMLASAHPQSGASPHHVAAEGPTRGLAADRAIAELIGVGRVRFNTELHATALAGSFEQHGLCVRPPVLRSSRRAGALL